MISTLFPRPISSASNPPRTLATIADSATSTTFSLSVVGFLAPEDEDEDEDEDEGRVDEKENSPVEKSYDTLVDNDTEVVWYGKRRHWEGAFSRASIHATAAF